MPLWLGERERLLETALDRLAARRRIDAGSPVAPIDRRAASRAGIRIRKATVHEVVALVGGELIRLAAVGELILAADHGHLGVVGHGAALRARRAVAVPVEDVGAGVGRAAFEAEVTAIRALDPVP